MVPFLRLQVRSTTETSAVGTRNAMPVSLPLTSGMTLATALAAPVDDGMMFPDAQRPGPGSSSGLGEAEPADERLRHVELGRVYIHGHSAGPAHHRKDLEGENAQGHGR